MLPLLLLFSPDECVHCKCCLCSCSPQVLTVSWRNRKQSLYIGWLNSWQEMERQTRWASCTKCAARQRFLSWAVSLRIEVHLIKLLTLVVSPHIIGPPPQLMGLAVSRKFCTSSGRKLLIYISMFDWDPYKQCLQRSIQAHVPTRAIERAGVVEKATS